jgi:hypothetical protein
MCMLCRNASAYRDPTVFFWQNHHERWWNNGVIFCCEDANLYSIYREPPCDKQRDVGTDTD